MPQNQGDHLQDRFAAKNSHARQDLAVVLQCKTLSSNMMIVYCFHPGDEELALKNARWMNELGGCKEHDVWLITDKRCRLADDIRNEMHSCFNRVHAMKAGAEMDGWPQAANYFFRTACGYLQSRPIAYFMWMEPDAIPLKEGWATALELEYNQKCLPSGKRFMGDRVQVENIPLHMSGVGIYCNPIHVYAGEAYRAHEVAWDMAAKDQIIPHAYWTKQIEHAWKHPTFTDPHELTTQIRPEAVVFHSSKDGSLIDLLRSRQGRKQHTLGVQAEAVGYTQKEPEEPGSPSLIMGGDRERLSTGVVRPGARDDLSSPSLIPLTCDIFIRTYPGDYQWLEYCLAGIQKYAKGFRHIYIVSPAGFKEDYNRELFRNVIWLIRNEEAEDGYLSQQIHKLYADVITDYQADYILHLDSDVILSKEVTPYNFFRDGKPEWFFTPYSEIVTPWQPITEKFLNDRVENEFMRRLPILIPRWLYPKLREFCHKQHGVIVSDYIRNQPQRAFSEFNALGAYAYKYHHDRFTWWDTTTKLMPAPCAKQFRSYDGITPEVKLELDRILDAVPVQADATSDKKGLSEAKGASPQRDCTQYDPAHTRDSRGGIKILPNDIWVLEGDQISQWVEQEGRLDHDQNLLPKILEHIKYGDTVLDVGAFIGDHTVAYAKQVGPEGKVIAFEPNPLAFGCLRYNTKTLGNVHTVPCGTSDRTETVPLSGNNGNAGGSYVGDHMKVADIELQPLDLFQYVKVDLIKIDVEGYELKTILGAKDLIARCRPIMVVEVNYEALKRQGARVGDLLDTIEKLGYSHRIIQENCCLTSPLYDILCTPGVALPGAPDPGKERMGLLAVDPTASPPAFNFRKAIADLEVFAGQSSVNRMLVVKTLGFAGLHPRNPPKKKKKK